MATTKDVGRSHEEIKEESLLVFGALDVKDDENALVEAEATVTLIDEEGIQWEGSAYVNIPVKRRRP